MEVILKNRKAEPGLRLINMEDVAVEQVEWLLYPFIPYGKVTIIQGDPGEGKTTMVLQIIAKLTKGESVLPNKDGEEKQEEQTKNLHHESFVMRCMQWLKNALRLPTVSH